ncbi:hypothetical protein EIP86_004084 [Pleurotus ostreatoroseus]|nr:hypothetical protein EIP86_004084 [Pleurotus ostreatoroseus]
MWFSWVIVVLGYGLMIQLDDQSKRYVVFLPMAAGARFMNAPAAMPLRDMATSTATFGFIRTLGGTVSISIGQAILSGFLRRKVRNIPGLDIDTSPAALNQVIKQIKNIPVRARASSPAMEGAD